MKFHIEFIENKNKDWKVMTVKDMAGQTFDDCSVNRVNKKGEVFPNFDALELATDFEGEMWTSDAGKRYIFAPRPQNAPNKGGYRNQQIEKATIRKEGFIEKTMSEKEEAIKTSSTFRDATLITLEFMKSEGGWSEDTFRERWAKTRKWLLNNWLPEPF